MSDKRMTDKRLAEIEQTLDKLDRFSTRFLFPEFAELLQALKAERKVFLKTATKLLDKNDRLEQFIKKLRARNRKILKELMSENAVLKSKLDSVNKCETYICHFSDIGKTGPAYRQRDVWKIIHGEQEQEK